MSLEAAGEIYKVVIYPVTLKLDIEETETLRASSWPGSPGRVS